MFTSSQLYGLVWYLVAVLPCLSTAQQIFPATVEVDLIFPRNNTYAPTPLMPIVFAIQNSHIAKPLINGFTWQLNRMDDYNIGTSSTLHLTHGNISSSNAYFAFDTIVNFTTTESTWTLIWTASSTNCSAPNSLEPGISGRSQSNHVIFTVKNGAQQPDLVAATSDTTCAANTESFTYNITEILNGTWITDYNTLDSCAVLASALPTPSPNPCEAKVDASAASSIWAAITSTACAGEVHPVVSCPPTKSGGNKAGHVVGAMVHHVWLTATVGWLLYILVL
jgi:hypothetical protein